MGWIKTFKRGDGGYDSFDWKISDSIAVDFITVLFGIILGFILGIIIPILMLFFYAWSIDSHRRKQSIVGLVCCAIGVLDFIFGGLAYSMWAHEYPNFFLSLATLFLSMGTIFVVLLRFDDFLFDMFQSFNYPVLTSLVWFGAIIFFTHPIFKILLEFIGVASKPFITF